MNPSLDLHKQSTMQLAILFTLIIGKPFRFICLSIESFLGSHQNLSIRSLFLLESQSELLFESCIASFSPSEKFTFQIEILNLEIPPKILSALSVQLSKSHSCLLKFMNFDFLSSI